MDLHALNWWTNEPIRWVGLPLEFVDWMAAHFDGKLIQHLRWIDPYNDVLIPPSFLTASIDEFVEVREYLKWRRAVELHKFYQASEEVIEQMKRRRASPVPEVVEAYGKYGTEGALKTATELVEFFEFTTQTPCKVLSHGD